MTNETSVAREQLIRAAMNALRPTHTLLDIGPGIVPQSLVDCRVHVCAEPFPAYAESLATKNPQLVVVNCSWSAVIDLLPEGSVDTIVLFDVIEHVEKDEAQKLLELSVRLARSQVAVFTPLGFMPQGENETKDAWGLDGLDWQIHRSGWSPSDFPGWRTIVCEEYHLTDAYGRTLDKPFGAFFAILDKDAGHEPGTVVRLKHWQRTSDSRAGKTAVALFSKAGVRATSLLRGLVRQ